MANPNPVLSPSAPALTVGQTFERSWLSVKDQIALVAGLSLVVMLGLFAASSLPVVGWALNAVIGVGYIACLLRVRRGESFEFADFLWAFQNMNRLIHVILAAILVFVAAVFGTILMIIPGIWIYVMLSLTTVVQVKGDLDGVIAVKSSYNLVEGHWWRVFGVLLFILGLNLLGALCFMVGLLVTMPLSYLMLIEITEDLQRLKGTAAAPTPATAPPGSSNFQVNPT